MFPMNFNDNRSGPEEAPSIPQIANPLAYHPNSFMAQAMGLAGMPQANALGSMPWDHRLGKAAGMPMGHLGGRLPWSRPPVMGGKGGMPRGLQRADAGGLMQKSPWGLRRAAMPKLHGLLGRPGP